MSEYPSESSPSWKRPAFLAVVLAILLCVSGLVLAIRQSNAPFDLSLSDLRAQARFLAYQLGDEVVDRCDRVLMPVSFALENDSFGRVALGSDWPEWLGQPHVWSDGTLTRLPIRTTESSARSALALPRASMEYLLRLGLAGHSQATLSRGGNRATRILSGWVDNRPAALAYRLLSIDGVPQHLIVPLDVELLEGEFEARISSLTTRIRLTSTDIEPGTWTESLGPELHFWSLMPAPAHVAEVRREMFSQMAVNVLATLAAVAALLAMVGGLVRVARRESALSRLKSDFVADVSHELKTPLALIRMFGEMLLAGRVASAEKAREYYEIITRESNRLTHLIDNILDFSRNDAGKTTYQMQPLDIGRVVRQTYDSYRHELDHQGFEHSLSLDDNLPTIHGDADAVAQAVLNLLSNAVKYSDTEKSVTVRVTQETRRDRHGVLIAVQDNGIGIKPEDQARLFDGFYRGSGDQVRRRRGTGLGLAVVKQVVESHGGSVEAEARLVKGSIFRIFFPTQEPARG